MLRISTPSSTLAAPPSPSPPTENLRYIPGPKQLIELNVGGFMLGELLAFALATPVQVCIVVLVVGGSVGERGVGAMAVCTLRSPLAERGAALNAADRVSLCSLAS